MDIMKKIDELKNKAQKILNLTPSLKATIRESKTYVGGGTMPNKTIPTIVIEIEGNATSWEKKFRKKLVIGRIENNKFILDMRTIQDDEIETLVNIINELISCKVQ